MQLLTDTIRVWKQPDKDFHYVVRVDPGLGRNTQTAITVWRFWFETVEKGEVSVEQEFGEHCATYAGWLMPDPTAILAKKLASHYNNALQAVEANGHGIAVLSGLQGYKNIYMRMDLVRGKKTRSPGWLTTTRTKPYMISEVAKMLSKLEIHDQDVVEQLKHIRLNGGDYVAAGLDDIFMSMAIAVACRGNKV